MERCAGDFERIAPNHPNTWIYLGRSARTAWCRSRIILSYLFGQYDLIRLYCCQLSSARETSWRLCARLFGQRRGVSRVMSSRVQRPHVMLPPALRTEQPGRVRLREFSGQSCTGSSSSSARFQVKSARLHGAREVGWEEEFDMNPTNGQRHPGMTRWMARLTVG
jgi:hypothetical protein